MKKALFALACLLLGGCATLKSAVDGVADGVCWLDNQIPACEWAGEEPVTPVNDPIPGGK